MQGILVASWGSSGFQEIDTGLLVHLPEMGNRAAANQQQRELSNALKVAAYKPSSLNTIVEILAVSLKLRGFQQTVVRFWGKICKRLRPWLNCKFWGVYCVTCYSSHQCYRMWIFPVNVLIFISFSIGTNVWHFTACKYFCLIIPHGAF